ncbi:DUF4932 domain-containing protein [Ascidiimonas aurantiaca]|uniref:DUF4932 domain-containing protein n=1 Tax=Ascidiimonas aurantiaca TaxID=1685432 RepID=UPI0030EB8C48
MKKTVIVLTCMLGVKYFAHAQEKLNVSFNQNIEFIGLVYTIIYENPNNPLFDDQTENWPYGQQILKEYGRFGKNATLNALLPRIEYLWISDFNYLLAHIPDFPNARLPENFNINRIIHFSQRKDPAEAKENVTFFLETMNAFYKEVQFDQYMKKNAVYYKAVVREIKKHLFLRDFITPMEAFYNFSFEKYQVIPSLTLPPGMGFATQDGSKIAFNVISAVSTQNLPALQMGFDDPDALRELNIHEFAHSLLAPSFQHIPKTLMKSTEYLHEPVKTVMRKQNYLTWSATLNEHLVRAGEVLIARILNDPESEQQLLTTYKDQKDFRYLPIIIPILYENFQNRVSYKEGMLKAVRALEAVKNRPKTSARSGLILKGVVRSAKSGTPIPFVNIGVFHKNFGVISREDGTFEIDLRQAKPEDRLSFSSLGYTTYNLPIKDIQNSFLTVQLKEKTIQLEEVVVRDKEIFKTKKLGRVKPSKRTLGESNSTHYGKGGEYGIRIVHAQRYMLQDVNFHMRFNTTDSILFRINIYNVKNDLPHTSLLQKELFMKSYRGQKWIHKDFSDQNIVIDKDVIVTYEIVKIWYSNKTYNNIFFTYGKGYEEGSKYRRTSSHDRWQTEEGAIPITLYLTGRLF